MERYTLYWKIFSDARTAQAARRVGNRVLQALDLAEQPLTIAPYPKTGGHTIEFEAQTTSSSWPDLIVSVLEQAQRIGHGWMLSGSIREQLGILTNRSSISGVRMLLCDVTRSTTDQGTSDT
jgi:hypothetical protein